MPLWWGLSTEQRNTRYSRTQKVKDKFGTSIEGVWFHGEMKSSTQKAGNIAHREERMTKVTVVVHPQGLSPKEAGKAWYSRTS